MRTIFEQAGGSYTRQGDYFLPDLKLTEKKQTEIGTWSQRHRRYLKQHHKIRYYNLLTNGRLNEYLSDIEEQAQQLFLRLVKELAEKEKATEELKAADAMAWVRKMNSIRSRATEIVNEKVIFT